MHQLLLLLGEKNSEDEDDREQERLAKRFAKRARMNRLLEMHNSDTQFSRSRLLDEDVTLQKDLKAIKVSCLASDSACDCAKVMLTAVGSFFKECSFQDLTKCIRWVPFQQCNVVTRLL